MFETENPYRALPLLEDPEKPLGRQERLRAVNGPLIAWYRQHARTLPWRTEPTPYRVWISEIMLQQTRVEAVKPYFERFMKELPDVEALAAVSEERLFKLWEGLGYYSRARNLKRAAGMILADYGGRIPDSREELLKLPGIGSYTAGAIASIAYGKPEPAVDGNVLRVLSRLLASRDDILRQDVKRRFETDLACTMPRDFCGDFTQGLIELGALVCVPNGSPDCGSCPLASICLSLREGLTQSIPYRAPKKPRRIDERTILLIRSGDRIAIQKRPDKGLLASLYEFPGLDGVYDGRQVEDLMREKGCVCLKSAERMADAVHIFTHAEWHMRAYLITVDAIPPEYLAAEIWEIREKYPLPNAFDKYIKLINGES